MALKNPRRRGQHQPPHTKLPAVSMPRVVHKTEAFYRPGDVFGYKCSCGWHWKLKRYWPPMSIEEAASLADDHVARDGLEKYEILVMRPYVGNGTAWIKNGMVEAHSWQEALTLMAAS